MARSRSNGLRRPLTIYGLAVVGPTLVLLTLAILTVRRQAETVRAQAASNLRLHEQRIQEEIDSHIQTISTRILRDPTFLRAVPQLASTDMERVASAQQVLTSVGDRHPALVDAYLAGPAGVIYPPIQPPLRLTFDEALRDEPDDQRQQLAGLLTRSNELQDARNWPRALQTVRRAHALATSTRGKALAQYDIARILTASGDSHAQAEWQTLVNRYSDVYTLEGRPIALVAATHLDPAVPVNADMLERVEQRLETGSWVLTPAMDHHFRTQLGFEPPNSSRQSRRLEFARDLDTGFRVTQIPEPDGIEFATLSVDTRRHLLAFARLDANTVAGIRLEERWLEKEAARLAAAQQRDGTTATVAVCPSGAAIYRPGLAPWCVTLSSKATSVWRGRDLAIFVAGIAAVVGALIVGVVLLARDVGREVEMNRLRADMVGGVSHELKAPLSVIRIYAETIRESMRGVSGQGAQFAETIVQETDRLHRLIDDVVDFSRIQQGQRQYSLSSRDLRPVLTEIADRFSGYARLHGLSLTARIPPTLPPVRFDRRALEQAVMNLLDNAAKYSGDSQEIMLTVLVSAHEVAIEVADHGLGIAAEDQAGIFERFRRGDHRDRGGYGLGLYLVRHVMAAHAGSVEVSSERGLGSRFTLRLPVELPEVARA